MLLSIFTISWPKNIVKVKAASNPSITYTYSKSNIRPGETFDINVNISNVSDLYGASIDFKYDQTLFSIESIVSGNIWNGQVYSSSYLEDNRSSGYVSFYTSLTGDKTGVNGSGTIFVIKAKALRTGNYTLKTINSDSALSNSGNNVRLKLSNSQLAQQKISYTASASTLNIYNNYIEDTNANIAYSGEWQSQSNGEFSGGTVKYINAPGSLTFTFTGTGIKMYSTTSAYRGIAKVTIDGTAYYADMYSPSTVTKKVVFEKNGLSNTTHTVKVEYTGTKSTSSQGTIIMVDAFEIVNGSIVEANRVEDSSNFIAYSGNWASQSNNSFSGKTVKYINSPGSVSFSFTGTGIRILSTTSTYRGIAKVIIDGTVYYVSMYSPTTINRNVVFEKNDLNNGTHSIKIEYTGNKVAASSGNIVMIDAFDILEGNAAFINKIEDNSKDITYTGKWSTQSNSAFSGGTATHTSSTGSLTFTFTGTGLRLLTTTSMYRGIAKVTIDNVSYDVDMYSASTINNKVVFEKKDLKNGTHTVKIEYTGRKSSSSQGTVIMLDAIEVLRENAPVITKLEENSSTITYSGNWVNQSNSSFSGGTVKYASSNASLSFSFTGTGLRLYTTTTMYRGLAKVTVDGVAYNVDMYSSNAIDKNMVFELTNLSNGTHSVKVEFTGSKTSESKGTIIMVDYFEILSESPLSVTRVEESNSAITYKGNWQKQSTTSFSGGTAKYVNSSASLSYTFTGTGIRLITTTSAYRGIAKVTLDNTIYYVDMYTASTIDKNTVFQKTNLKNGTHVIKVEFVGLKSNASNGTIIMVDAFEVIN